jgi:hypothetical protein
MDTINILGFNIDHARIAQQAAAENIDLQISAIKRAEGGLQTLLHDNVVQLIDAKCWKTERRAQWKRDLFAAMLTDNERYIINVMQADAEDLNDGGMLSGSMVEKDKKHPEQAYISTFRNHL